MGLKLELAADLAAVKPPQLIAIGNPKSDSRVAALMKSYGLELTPAMAKEGYVLGIGPQGIVIGADSDRGLLYGTMTLRQMLQVAARSNRCRRCAMHDWP